PSRSMIDATVTAGRGVSISLMDAATAGRQVPKGTRERERAGVARPCPLSPTRDGLAAGVFLLQLAIELLLLFLRQLAKVGHLLALARFRLRRSAVRLVLRRLRSAVARERLGRLLVELRPRLRLFLRLGDRSGAGFRLLRLRLFRSPVVVGGGRNRRVLGSFLLHGGRRRARRSLFLGHRALGEGRRRT